MIWHELTHWPTHSPNHPPIHLSKGWSVSTNHKSSNRIELSRLDQVLLKFLWFHMFRPTNPPIHPPTHPRKHPPMGAEFSTDSKSLNGIAISRFVQVLSCFYWFGGVPPLGGGWVVGWGWGRVGAPPMHVRTHTRTYACAHTHTHARAYDITGNSQVFPLWGQPFAWNYHAYCAYMRMRARACACVCVRVGVAPPPTPPSTHPTTHQPPKGGVTPKTVKFQYVLN